MILIALGSSLPFCGLSPHETVQAAIKAIGVFAPVKSVSRFYISPAWPDASDPEFVNAVIAVETELGPEALMTALHRVEAAFARKRTTKNAPRTLDLDIIAYGDVIRTGDSEEDGDSEEVGAPGLVLPHPGLETRDFVLAPLSDIAPQWTPPGGSRTVVDMLKALKSVTARPI